MAKLRRKKVRFMTMSMEDKEKCADLYELFTGESIEALRWNEEAGDILALMVKEIVECSRVMGILGSLYPIPVKPSWTWLIGLAYKNIVNEFRVRKNRVNIHCYNRFIPTYKTSIKLAMLGI